MAYRHSRSLGGLDEALEDRSVVPYLVPSSGYHSSMMVVSPYEVAVGYGLGGLGGRDEVQTRHSGSVEKPKAFDV